MFSQVYCFFLIYQRSGRDSIGTPKGFDAINFYLSLPGRYMTVSMQEETALRNYFKARTFYFHMNYLAHLYLSGSTDSLLTVGNFLGDFVKGKKYLHYPSEIKKGILFHRAVDSYTDTHPLVLQSKKRLFTRYRHYSAVLVDLFYDHLLAANFQDYSQQPLPNFARDIYSLLNSHKQWLPEKAGFMLPYMMRDNWLVNYATLEGIGRACSGIARRTSFVSGLEKGPEDLRLHYGAFEEEFVLFFKDIQAYTKEWLESYPGEPI